MALAMNGKRAVFPHGVTRLRIRDRFGEFGFGDFRRNDADLMLPECSLSRPPDVRGVGRLPSFVIDGDHTPAG
jgi:hypothetical protein